MPDSGFFQPTARIPFRQALPLKLPSLAKAKSLAYRGLQRDFWLEYIQTRKGAMNEVTTDKLVNDLKVVVRDAEELLKATAGEMGDKAKVARERLSHALDNARKSCQNLEQRAMESAKATDEIVRQHPYETIGVALGVGLLIGILLGRK
jgi:ElaB/YqjD/DUF883 family membrane-anchored ribosome-binding protein